jgi:hypothetical protein
MIKRISLAITAALLVVALSAPAALAAPLESNCERVQGEVTCTTTEGPGKNQGGVGTTETKETQGNTTNKAPAEEQELMDDCDQETNEVPGWGHRGVPPLSRG